MQNPKYAVAVRRDAAGICLTTEKFAAKAPAHVAVLVTPAPYRAFVAVAQKLYPGAHAAVLAVRGERRVVERAGASYGAARSRAW